MILNEILQWIVLVSLFLVHAALYNYLKRTDERTVLWIKNHLKAWHAEDQLPDEEKDD